MQSVAEVNRVEGEDPIIRPRLKHSSLKTILETDVQYIPANGMVIGTNGKN